MLQGYLAYNEIDPSGNPAGGTVTATGLEIKWQNGPIPREKGVNPEPSANGAFVETVIAAALQRIKFYQEVSGGKFSCRENAIAITKLEEALMWLDKRTRDREARGVEGTHQE
jgi:hypothetical protein